MGSTRTSTGPSSPTPTTSESTGLPVQMEHCCRRRLNDWLATRPMPRRVYRSGAPLSEGLDWLVSPENEGPETPKTISNAGLLNPKPTDAQLSMMRVVLGREDRCLSPAPTLRATQTVKVRRAS